MYKRVLLKLSGEQLAGRHKSGIDPEIAHYLAGELKCALKLGCQFAIVVGGGNLVRGAEVAGQGIRKVTADQMGMLSGLINAMALTDVFESEEVPTRCLSMVIADQVAEPYSYRRAEKHLQSNRVVIVAGGIARPYFTHDTAGVSVALELDCEVMIKASKVEGVYDKDPEKFTDAKLLRQVSFEDALSNTAIKVMDKAAIGLAMEQKMPLMVFDVFTPGNLAKLVSGEPIGTKIVP
jgi:uridylate kinase